MPTDDDCRAALELWLEYDRNRRQLTARLFANRENAADVQELLDQNERLREQAIQLSERWLQANPERQ